MTDLTKLVMQAARELISARYGDDRIRAAILAGDEDQATPVFNAILGARGALTDLRTIGLIFDSPGPFTIPHDGFVGDPIGAYVTREGKKGVVLQQIGTQVVHVYGRKWIDGNS